MSRFVAELDAHIEPLVRALAPSLIAAPGFGIHTTAQLLITMGDNPERIGSEPRFAKLCGVAPLDASSGKNQHHRLNRGGDRDANSALYIAILTRMRCDERTRTYVKRRTAEGKTKAEIIRCLKRYAAREAYYLIKHDHDHPEHTHTPARQTGEHRRNPGTLREKGPPAALLILKPQPAHPRNGRAGGQAQPGEAPPTTTDTQPTTKPH